MDKAEQIAKEIWKLSVKHAKCASTERIEEGFDIAGFSINTPELLRDIWHVKIDSTMEKFRRDARTGLGRELAYLVLEQSVREFLENG